MSDITVTANGANTVSATAKVGDVRLTGEVVMWSARGFGFVRRDNGKGDLFFHCKDVRGGDAAVGDRVEFSVGAAHGGRSGLAAFDVVLMK